MKRAFIFMILMTAASPVWAGDAVEYYSIRFSTAGLLARSSTVCGGDRKRTLKAAVKVLATDELRAMEKAFPKRTEEWMRGGGEAFNQGVMKDGIAAACRVALEARSAIEDAK